MLGRYQIKRGASVAQLPQEVRLGVRQDTRKHTRHVLRPDAKDVVAYLARSEVQGAWQRFATRYRALLNRRYRSDRGPFDELAALAESSDVFLGCSCPTAQNPSVQQCHTWIALEFFREKYPHLDVRFPG